MDNDNKRVSPSAYLDDDYDRWIDEHSVGVNYGEEYANDLDQINRNVEWLEFALEADVSHLENESVFSDDVEHRHNENMGRWEDELWYWKSRKELVEAEKDVRNDDDALSEEEKLSQEADEFVKRILPVDHARGTLKKLAALETLYPKNKKAIDTLAQSVENTIDLYRYSFINEDVEGEERLRSVLEEMNATVTSYIESYLR